MEKEIDHAVLAVIDEKRLSGVKLTPVEIITKMGVFDARTQASASAWLATGDNVIATIWAEQISVGTGGRWFYLESLDTHQRMDGSERSALQIQRAKDRLQLLKYALDEEQPVRVALQANRVAIDTVETDKAAKIGVRVIDDMEWHVVAWNTEEKFAVLVRGEKDWIPSATDITAARATGGVPLATGAGSAGQAPPEVVQAAAMAYMVRYFSSYGYRTENVASQHFGYDMEVSDKKGTTLLKLAVKGLGAGVRSFKLSPEELARAAEGHPWRLAVVTDSISPGAAHKLYNGAEYESAPGLELVL
jgi:hypothetical protein